MSHRHLCFILTICLATASGTAATREKSSDPPRGWNAETAVAETYARITDLAAAGDAVSPLRMEVSDLRSGPIGEILGSPLADLASLPSRGMILLTPVRNGDGIGSVMAQWEHGQYASLDNPLDTVGHVMSLYPARFYDVGSYVSYAVKVTLDGRSETYRALALIHDLFGASANPSPEFVDSVAGLGGTVTDIWLDKNLPRSGRVTMPASDAGAARSPLDRAVTSSDSPITNCLSGAAAMNKNGHNPDSFGYHWATGCVTVECKENGPDYQYCAASVSGIGADDVKTSPYEFPGYHVPKTDSHPDSHAGAYGTTVTCSATVGAGFKACPDRTCTYAFSATWQGVGVTVTGGADVWTTSVGLGMSCNLSKPVAVKCQSPDGQSYGYNDGSTAVDQQVCPDSPDGFNSPVLIDVDGNGFALTDLANGVAFDLNADGRAERVSWTAADSDDAFVALDRNGNGTIDNGLELFGNITLQRASSKPNGFAALKEFDGRENGGNGDGVIDTADAVFSRLVLWRDRNHNGFSEPDELQPLSSAGIKTLELDYKDSRKTDEFGNQLRYRAKVSSDHPSSVARWAWDVFFRVGS